MATTPGIQQLVLVDFGALVETAIEGIYAQAPNNKLVQTSIAGVYKLSN